MKPNLKLAIARLAVVELKHDIKIFRRKVQCLPSVVGEYDVLINSVKLHKLGGIIHKGETYGEQNRFLSGEKTVLKLEILYSIIKLWESRQFTKNKNFPI